MIHDAGCIGRCTVTWRAAARVALAAGIALFVTGSSRADVFGGVAQPDLDYRFKVEGYRDEGRFREPSAVALDERNGLLYIADQKAGAVYAFSLQGVAKFQYGSKQGLKAPVGLAVDRRGDVFVSENEGGPIKIIDSRGEVSTLELPADPDPDKDTSEPGKEAPKPGRMAFDRDGSLLVVDRANSQIYAFNKDRKFRTRFGTFGDKRGEFKLLQDVATDRTGRIYTADAMGVPVQVFDRKGGFIFNYGIRGRGPESLSFPTGIFVDRHDQIWVVDKTLHSIKVYDRMGVYLRSFGTYGQGEGDLFYPIAAVLDSRGRLYVLEFGTRRLQVFSLRRPFEPFNR